MIPNRPELSDYRDAQFHGNDLINLSINVNKRKDLDLLEKKGKNCAETISMIFRVRVRSVATANRK